MHTSWKKTSRLVTVALGGMLLGSVLIAPVGAHLNSPLTFKHVKKHFFTKKAANSAFVNVGEAATSALNAEAVDGLDSTALQKRAMWALVELDATPQILAQSGGITLPNGGAGNGTLSFPAVVLDKAISATAVCCTVVSATATTCDPALGSGCPFPGLDPTQRVYVTTLNSSGAQTAGKVYVVVTP